MRFKSYGAVLLASLVTAQLLAADPAVRLPQPAVLPQPMPPAPTPGAVVSLGADEWYAVESDAELIILPHPAGLLAFEKVEPGHFRGKFAGGGGKVESRKLKGPHVYLGTAAGKGRADIYFVPVGVKDRKDVVTATVDVLGGEGPRPPPDIDPPVTEKSPWDNAPGLRVLVVYPARGVLPAPQQSIVTGKRVRDFLDANCVKENNEPAYFIWKTGEDVTGTPAGWQKAYATVKGDRWVVVGNGPKWTAQPLPENPDKMLELLGGYR